MSELDLSDPQVQVQIHDDEDQKRKGGARGRGRSMCVQDQQRALVISVLSSADRKGTVPWGLVTSVQFSL